VTDIPTLVKTCKKYKTEPPRDLDQIWGAVWDGGKHQIVWINPTGDVNTTVNTIIHESVHVLQHAVKYVEEDSIGKEFEAYATADICMNIFAEYKKQQGLPDALHDERKTRLQKRESVIQLEARANQEPLGTDSGEAGSECQWTDT